MSSRAAPRPAPGAEAPDGETVTLWTRLSAEHELVIVGGFCERAAGQVYNSAALVDHGTLRCVYRKAHLWDRERLSVLSRRRGPARGSDPIRPDRGDDLL